jgi:hypothetical protein
MGPDIRVAEGYVCMKAIADEMTESMMMGEFCRAKRENSRPNNADPDLACGSCHVKEILTLSETELFPPRGGTDIWGSLKLPWRKRFSPGMKSGIPVFCPESRIAVGNQCERLYHMAEKHGKPDRFLPPLRRLLSIPTASQWLQ